MTEGTLAPAWRAWFRRRERALAALWLAGSFLLVAVLAWPPARVRLLGGLEAAVDRWNARWPARLARGEALLAGGRVAEAEAFLARLDREFPARSVRHGLDRDRERLLLALGRAEEAAGRRARALATYERLVEFDSLNYLNHFALGQARERLLGGWAVAPEARDAFEAALRRFPAHLPSLRGYLGYYLDRGEFPEVVAAYRRYLDAVLVHYLEIGVGDSGPVMAPVIADGLPRTAVVNLAAPAAGGSIWIRTRGFAVALDSVVLEPARIVGRIAAGSRMVLTPPPAELLDLEPAGPGRYRATGPASALRIDPPASAPIAGLTMYLRLFKPVDPDLWSGVERSYRNLLDWDGLAAAAARTVPLATALDADRALARLPWARDGRRLGPDEYPF